MAGEFLRHPLFSDGCSRGFYLDLHYCNVLVYGLSGLLDPVGKRGPPEGCLLGRLFFVFFFFFLPSSYSDVRCERVGL
jgi:hypothetical protein